MLRFKWKTRSISFSLFYPIGTMIPVYPTVLVESLDPVSISDLTSDKSSLSLSPSLTPRSLFSTEEASSNNYALCLISVATPVRQTK